MDAPSRANLYSYKDLDFGYGSVLRPGAVCLADGRQARSGTVEDSANGLVLANVSGESSPNNLQGTPRFLLATPLNKALPITNKQGAKPYSDTQRTRKEAGISTTGLFPGTALSSMLNSSEW